MEKLNNIFKMIIGSLFSYKNNIVVLFFTILSLCGCLISTNIVLSNTTRYENVVDGFPNQLVVECGVGMTDFKETKDSILYSKIKSFTVLSFSCEVGKPTYVNQFNTKEERVVIYGVDNNFFNSPIVIDSYQPFGFLDLEVLKHFSFQTVSFVENSLEAIVLTNNNYVWTRHINIRDKNLKIMNIVDLSQIVKEETTFIFVPITTFYYLFEDAENFIDWFIYSNDTNYVGSKNKLITKDDVVEKYNLKVQQANNYVNVMYFCLAIICFSNCIINVLNTKNRNVEIGVKLAFGAKKRTIVLEFLVEQFGIHLLGSILSFFFSAFIVLDIEAFLTLFSGFNYFYVNLPLSLFFISVYLLASLIFAIIPGAIMSNINIETILKEER